MFGAEDKEGERTENKIKRKKEMPSDKKLKNSTYVNMLLDKKNCISMFPTFINMPGFTSVIN
jgi:hypothetical protein